MLTNIASLGKCEIRSPLAKRGGLPVHFRTDSDRILFDDSLDSFKNAVSSGETPRSLEVAGPREHIFFDPSRTTAGIVTCGGLCPGLNDVIRSLVMQLYHRSPARIRKPSAR